MKVSCSYEHIEFEPVELKIVLENKEDLIELWSLTNISMEEMGEIISRNFTTDGSCGNQSHDLWAALEKLLEMRNIKRT